MSIENNTEEFITALNGGKGDLDAWLECNNESECRIAINEALKKEREKIATWIEFQRNDVPATGEEFAKAIRLYFNA